MKTKTNIRVQYVNAAQATCVCMMLYSKLHIRASLCIRINVCNETQYFVSNSVGVWDLAQNEPKMS